MPCILKNTVMAEQREKVIDARIAAGVNVVVCNPEFVKTGLDLFPFPTLFFHEITFNLGAMLVRPTRTGGVVKLWTVDLDADAWTRLITGGLARQTIFLPKTIIGTSAE